MSSFPLVHRFAWLRWGASSSRRAPEAVVDLPSGARQTWHLRAGESLLVRTGAVTVHGPAAWLGEALVASRVALREGERHVALAAQRVHVEAHAASRIHHLPHDDIRATR